MKIIVEVEIFDDPEFCGYSSIGDKSGFCKFLNDCVDHCHLYSEQVEEIRLGEKGIDYQKCPQCKAAYQKANKCPKSYAEFTELMGNFLSGDK